MVTARYIGSMRLRPPLGSIALLLWVYACLGCSSSTPSETTTPETKPETTTASAGDEHPRLVVLIVLDQLGQWVFDEYLPLLPKDSVLRRMHDTGTVHQGVYSYAHTATAAGHSTIATGVNPSVHGVVANEVYDRKLGIRKTVDDRQHAVIGGEDRFASPSALRTPTVADMLLSLIHI